jgi:hypothetical protein
MSGMPEVPEMPELKLGPAYYSGPTYVAVGPVPAT